MKHTSTRLHSYTQQMTDSLNN